MELTNFITGLVQQFPIIATILLVIGAMRVVFKPIFSVLHSYVDYTPNPKDNLILEKVEASPYYKAVVWFLDFFGSIKVSK